MYLLLLIDKILKFAPLICNTLLYMIRKIAGNLANQLSDLCSRFYPE